jgi:hypothetical protein
MTNGATMPLWRRSVDRSIFPIQGPPGAGKTLKRVRSSVSAGGVAGGAGVDAVPAGQHTPCGNAASAAA